MRCFKWNNNNNNNKEEEEEVQAYFPGTLPCCFEWRTPQFYILSECTRYGNAKGNSLNKYKTNHNTNMIPINDHFTYMGKAKSESVIPSQVAWTSVFQYWPAP